MNNLPLRLLPILAIAIMTAGCQLDGRTFLTKKRTQEQAHRLLIHPNNAHELGYSIQWATDLNLAEVGGVSHTALFDDVLIVVAAETNLVSAVSVRDGTINWQHSLGESADRLYPPVRSGNRVLINSETHLYSLDINRGNLLTVSELESIVRTSPAVVGDYAIFGGANNQVFAHDATAGYSKWSYKLTAPIIAPPVPIGDNVFTADQNGVYALFDGDSGELLWKGRTFASIAVPPSTSPLGIFVASEDHSLYALNTSTGRDRWIFRHTSPLTIQPELIGRNLYLTLPDEGLACINPRNGEELWRINDKADPVTQTPDHLLTSKLNVLQLHDTLTGETKMAIQTSTLKTVLADGKGRLFLISGSGRLLRLDPIS